MLKGVGTGFGVLGVQGQCFECVESDNGCRVLSSEYVNKWKEVPLWRSVAFFSMDFLIG